MHRHWAVRPRPFNRIEDDVAERLVDGAARMPRGLANLLLEDFHGRATTVGQREAAFALRECHYVAAACGMSSPGDLETSAAMEAWALGVFHDLESVGLPGGYVNFLAPSDDDRVAAFYGDRTDELRRLKRRLDPTDIFRYATGRLAPACTERSMSGGDVPPNDSLADDVDLR